VQRISIGESAEPKTPRHGPADRSRFARGLKWRLLRAERACRLCDVSLATWWRWDSSGLIPAGIKISSGTKRWRCEELIAWIRAGCPDRGTWNAMMQRNQESTRR
jgi:predicted DNA-binding transcriptional regulator AlpA